MRMTTLAGTCAILVMSAAAAVAGPCAPGQQANAQNRSSTVDPPSTATVTPGAKAESPGTVGAMQNVGANATSPSDVAKQSKGEKTAAQEGNNC